MKYNYVLKRSARKSISVTVAPDNKITVRCPYGLSEKRIEDFLEKKSAWINRRLNDNSQRLGDIESMRRGEITYVNGKILPVIISDENKITEDAVYLTKINNLRKLLESTFGETLRGEVRALARETRLYPISVQVKKYKSRWGCCNEKREICFNYALFMVSPELRRYVIIHELCHIKHMNHSKNFWALVQKYDKDYKVHRKQLKNFNFIPSLIT